MVAIAARAQFTYGTTGLLNMPTADMQRDKTVMIGGGYLENHATPTRWFYDTYNYYLNVTFFPWLEVAYTCTLFKALEDDPYAPGFWVPRTYGTFVNQDRNFSVRLRLWKGGWWKAWTPQIVVGSNDVLNASHKGGSINPQTDISNGHYSRYYIAATKHLDFQGIGNLGIHAAYLYNKRTDYDLNGPALGANFQLALPEDKLLNKALNGVNLMAEYDSRTINIGMGYTLWKDHINLIAELNECKYLSAGVYFKVHLK
ncbi:MAG: YjbH domain-containing protein [Phocaeicola sp.]